MLDAVNENRPLIEFEKEEEEPDKSVIEFGTTAVAVMEDVGSLNVTIIRHGKVDEAAQIKLDTIDGSAEEEEDYIGIHDVFSFNPGQTEMEVEVEIVDDDDWEPDEEFFLKIAIDPDCENKNIKIGKKNIMTIMILNDDEPGTFGFDKRGHFVKVEGKPI